VAWLLVERFGLAFVPVFHLQRRGLAARCRPGALPVVAMDMAMKGGLRIFFGSEVLAMYPSKRSTLPSIRGNPGGVGRCAMPRPAQGSSNACVPVAARLMSGP